MTGAGRRLMFYCNLREISLLIQIVAYFTMRSKDMQEGRIMQFFCKFGRVIPKFFGSLLPYNR